MKTFHHLLISAALLAAVSVDAQVDTVDSCRGRSAKATFEPWDEHALSELECKKISDGRPGSCVRDAVCTEGGQGEEIHFSTGCQAAPTGAVCCGMKSNCTAIPVASKLGRNLEGACMLPKYCPAAVGERTKAGNCGGPESGLACCVNQEPKSTGVNCPNRYTSIEKRIRIVQDKFDTPTFDLTRLTNFLPFAMSTFERLRSDEYCAPMGDCSAATYIAFFYHMLNDFTTKRPNEVMSDMLDAVPLGTYERLREELEKYDGHLTPEAFGKIMEILWEDDDLDLTQYNAGTCADWMRMAHAVRGPNHTWKCDGRWYWLLAGQYCRPTIESNLADCADGDGICYINGNATGVCKEAGLVEMPSSNSECSRKHGYENAFCCAKRKPTSSVMTMLYNAYENVRIAIDPSVKEDKSIIDTIKKSFTEASNALYVATDSRAHFGSIRIILPSTWSADFATDYTTDDKTSDAEFVVKPDISLEEDGVLPSRITINTIQLAFCGSSGLGTTLTPSDMQGGLGPRNIAKHFARGQYGIFPEFPRTELEMVPRDALNNLPPMCTQDNGTFYLYCNETGEVSVESTTDKSGSVNWLPDYSNVPGVDKIVHFCTSRKCEGHRNHNHGMENTHNSICFNKSAMEVILENKDFAGNGVPPRPGLKTTPTFVIVHPEFDTSAPATTAQTPDGSTTDTALSTLSTTKRTEGTTTTKKPQQSKTLKIVLVLDDSGSMGGSKIDNLKAAAGQFVDLTDEGIEVAAVSFTSSARLLSSFRKGDKDGKTALKTAISTLRGSGSTCIQDGLDLAVSQLKATGEYGGQIILMTDGENGCGDYYSASMPGIVEQGATVHTVAMTSSADKNLEALAEDTGGSPFQIANPSDIVEFLIEMQSILAEARKGTSSELVMLYNDVVEVSSQQDNDIPIYLDQGLGSQNLISALYDASKLGSMSAKMISPEGAQTVQCDDEPNFNKVNCELNFKPEAGDWTLRLRPSTSSSVSTTVTVTASATINTTETDTFSLEGKIMKAKISADPTPTNSWETPSILDKAQAFVGLVSYGRFAVIGAEVTAVVKHQNGKQWRQSLSDNGEAYDDNDGADLFANDGVYSGLFKNFNKAGRYSVSLEVVAEEGKAFYTRDVILGVPKSAKYLSETAAFRNYVKFTRVLSIGMFEVTSSKSNEVVAPNRRKRSDATYRGDVMPVDVRLEDLATIHTPSRVSNLKIMSQTTTAKHVQFILSWTAVGEVGMAFGAPSFYRVNVSTNALEVQGRGEEIEVLSIVDGRVFAVFPVNGSAQMDPGLPLVTSINLRLARWSVGRTVYISVDAVNVVNEAFVAGAHSNIVTAIIGDPESGVCSSKGSGVCESAPKSSTTKYQRMMARRGLYSAASNAHYLTFL